MSGASLGTNPAASADLTAKYSKLYQTYRLAVNGAHFGPSATTLSGAPLWEWADPSGSGIPTAAYCSAMAGHGAARAAAFDAAARVQQRQLFMGMNAYDRHKKMVHDLVTYYGGQLPQGGQAAPSKSDWDILRDNFRFIRSEEDDAADSWEVRLAKRYYSKLFKEYAIADLSRYQEGRVGLRWRTQKEVVSGRGQFVCGAKDCDERRGLASFEVPFAYQEAGERKQALVKLRLCPTHAYQLNYRKHQEAEAAARRREKEARRKARRRKKEREERRRKRKGRSKERRRSGKRRRGSSSSSSSGGSSGSTSSSSPSSSSDSSSSSSSEDEGGGQRGGRSKRRRSGGGGAAPHAQQEQQQGGGGAPQAAAAAAAGVPGENDFEAFLRGLFE